jgi:Protein of unknown function (DUF2975)
MKGYRMSLAALRKRALIVKWLVTLPLALLIVVTIGLIGNIIWQGGRYADGVALYYTPMFFYLWAIWMVRQALKAIAAGDGFSLVVPKLLSRVGLALFCGAVFREVGYPLVTWLINGHAHIRTFEASGVTIGVIGLSLMLFAQLLGQAAVMRQELDEFV